MKCEKCQNSLEDVNSAARQVESAFEGLSQLMRIEHATLIDAQLNLCILFETLTEPLYRAIQSENADLKIKYGKADEKKED